MKIMLIAGSFLPIQKIYTNIIMAKGETKKMFYFSFVKQTIRIFVLITLVILKVDVSLLAIGFSSTSVIGSLLYIVLGMHIMKYSLFQLIKDSAKTILTLMLSISFTKYIITIYFSSITLTLIFGFLLTITIYVISNIIIKNCWLSSTIKLIKK
jgi:O-antigen/teichoic acid export membrane protein